MVCWRLGYPSFWDPDEARYAEASREMLTSNEWLAPLYDSQPFFDKPILFYWLQMISFRLFGATEFGARAPVAVSTLVLFSVVAWTGRELFDRKVANLGALMFAVLPATFALSGYAILDMTFTLFLFGGAALVTTAALRDRPRRQYPGYVLLALAVLTKGPVALVLAGLAFLLSLVFVPEIRAKLWALRWGLGLLIVVTIPAPWFLYMWFRFGSAFVDGYGLRENLWLYSRPLYGNQPSYLFYIRVMATGLLPWTPVLAGRMVDVIRGHRLDVSERLLWAWSIAIVGFFTFSRFKLDHYVYPAAPALCLLCAAAWMSAQDAGNGRRGVVGGALLTAILLIVSGIIVVPAIDRVRVDLSAWARLVPLGFIVAGVHLLFQMRGDGWRVPSLPVTAMSALVWAYFVVVLIGFPAFERVKPIKGLAQSLAAIASPDDRIALYRMDRWSSSFRFYVDRPTEHPNLPEQLQQFLAMPGRHYVAMQRREFDAMVAQGYPLKVVYQGDGLFTTTGRGLKRGRGHGRVGFVVATDE